MSQGKDRLVANSAGAEWSAYVNESLVEGNEWIRQRNDRLKAPQSGEPIGEIGGNGKYSQSKISLLIGDCRTSPLWFQAFLTF
jgi:hypothetical protein